MLILLNAFLCGRTSPHRASSKVEPYSSDVTSAVHVTGSLAECVTYTRCMSLLQAQSYDLNKAIRHQ
jgi:hypothetical protein